MKIKIKLTEESINSAIKELERYKASLPTKIDLFMRRLSESGIQVAETFTQVQLDDMGSLGYLVEFSCEIEHGKNTTIGYFVGKDKAKYISQWVVKDPSTGREVVKSAEVSPILFYEFGAGAYAIDGHRGTFPSETASENANKEGGWWYKDLDGEWYHSVGTQPTQPMFHAWEEMKKRIRKIGKEVFKE